MMSHMIRLACKDGKIFGAVVGFVVIFVMNDLAIQKHSPNFLGRHKSMLIDIATTIGERMTRRMNVNVPILINISAAIECWIAATALRGTCALYTAIFRC